MQENLKNWHPGEENFAQEMKSTVEPYLASVRIRGTLCSADGTKLAYTVYEDGTPSRTLVLVHGFCEFTEKYSEVIFRLLQLDFRICTLELRGHGYSQRLTGDGSMVHVWNFEDYVSDLRALMENIVCNYSEPSILLGHSMGGLVAAMYLQTYPDDFSGAILASPMIRMRTGGLPYSLSWLGAEAACLCGKSECYVAGQSAFKGIRDFAGSSCLSPARYDYLFQKRIDCKAYQTWSASWGWLCAACHASAVTSRKQNIRKIHVPVLLLVAENDAMVWPEWTERFAAQLLRGKLVRFENSKHEIWNAQTEDRNKFYSEISAFSSALSPV